MASPYWQHNDPLKCPKGHKMGWLGSFYWICGKGKCNTIYVEEPPYDERRKRIERHQKSKEGVLNECS
jgi:hypothetical protein